jgi:hypothetical protein
VVSGTGPILRLTMDSDVPPLITLKGKDQLSIQRREHGCPCK